MAHVTVKDIVARALEEFPGVVIRLENVTEDFMEATFIVRRRPNATRSRQCWERLQVLNQKAKLFNAHFNLGHRQRKTNWWNVG